MAAAPAPVGVQEEDVKVDVAVPAGAVQRVQPLSPVVLVVAASLNLLLTGALVLGWSGIVLMLDRDGLYTGLCPTGVRVCEARDLRISGIYSVASMCLLASSLPLGLVIDRVGPRLGMAASNLLALVGALLVATMPAGGEAASGLDHFVLGFVIISFFAPGLQMAAASLANFFPSNEGLVIGIMSGCVGGSALTPIVYAAISKGTGASVQQMFVVHACLVGLFAAAALLQPWAAVPNQQPEQPALQDGGNVPRGPAAAAAALQSDVGGAESPDVSLAGASSKHLVPPGGSSPGHESTPSKGEPRKGCWSRLQLCATRGEAVEFAMLTQFTLVHTFRLMLFLGSSPLRLRALASDGNWDLAGVTNGTTVEAGGGGETSTVEHAEESWLTVFGWIAPFGALFGPVAGWVLDKWGPSAGVNLVHWLGVLQLAIALVPLVQVQPLAFVAYTTQQEGLFAVILAIVLQDFGERRFGTMAGVMLLLVSTAALVVQPVIEAVMAAAAASAGGVTSESVRAAFRVVDLITVAVLAVESVWVLRPWCRRRPRTPAADEPGSRGAA